MVSLDFRVADADTEEAEDEGEEGDAPEDVDGGGDAGDGDLLVHGLRQLGVVHGEATVVQRGGDTGCTQGPPASTPPQPPGEVRVRQRVKSGGSTG